MQAHAEHQQNDADLRQLCRQLHVRHKARRIGTENDTRREIADQHGEFQPMGDKPHQQG